MSDMEGHEIFQIPTGWIKMKNWYFCSILEIIYIVNIYKYIYIVNTFYVLVHITHSTYFPWCMCTIDIVFETRAGRIHAGRLHALIRVPTWKHLLFCYEYLTSFFNSFQKTFNHQSMTLFILILINSFCKAQIDRL